MSAEDLSRRALAWEHWQWMKGTVVMGGAVVAQQYGDRFVTWAVDGDTITDLMEPDPDEDFPDLDNSATQGNAIELIARHNHRKSKSDALRDIAHAMGRGLSMPAAIVFVMEECQ